MDRTNPSCRDRKRLSHGLFGRRRLQLPGQATLGEASTSRQLIRLAMSQLTSRRRCSPSKDGRLDRVPPGGNRRWSQTPGGFLTRRELAHSLTRSRHVHPGLDMMRAAQQPRCPRSREAYTRHDPLPTPVGARFALHPHPCLERRRPTRRGTRSGSRAAVAIGG